MQENIKSRSTYTPFYIRRRGGQQLDRVLCLAHCLSKAEIVQLSCIKSLHIDCLATECLPCFRPNSDMEYFNQWHKPVFEVGTHIHWGLDPWEIISLAQITWIQWFGWFVKAGNWSPKHWSFPTMPQSPWYNIFINILLLDLLKPCEKCKEGILSIPVFRWGNQGSGGFIHYVQPLSARVGVTYALWYWVWFSFQSTTAQDLLSHCCFLFLTHI